MLCGVQDARALSNPAQAQRSVGYGDAPLYLRASGTRPRTKPMIIWVQLIYVAVWHVLVHRLPT